jgi:hypothetical protein
MVCHCAEYHNAECHNVECRDADCHYADCRRILNVANTYSDNEWIGLGLSCRSKIPHGSPYMKYESTSILWHVL